MAKFRKKPVTIEAHQFTGKDSYWEMPKVFNDDPGFIGKTSYFEDTNDLSIFTLEGDMKAKIGDWIIKGVKGEYYPCKPDIFESTYEPLVFTYSKMGCKEPLCGSGGMPFVPTVVSEAGVICPVCGSIQVEAVDGTYKTLDEALNGPSKA